MPPPPQAASASATRPERPAASSSDSQRLLHASARARLGSAGVASAPRGRRSRASAPTRGPGGCARASRRASRRRRRRAATGARPRRCSGTRTVIRTSPRELDDELGRGAEVERARDDALDARLVRRLDAPVGPSSHVELLGPDDRVAALAGREAVGVGARPSTPASSSTVAPSPSASVTVPGIRFETPMKPATKVVVGRS